MLRDSNHRYADLFFFCCEIIVAPSILDMVNKRRIPVKCSISIKNWTFLVVLFLFFNHLSLWTIRIVSALIRAFFNEKPLSQYAPRHGQQERIADRETTRQKQNNARTHESVFFLVVRLQEGTYKKKQKTTTRTNVVGIFSSSTATGGDVKKTHAKTTTRANIVGIFF
jgi:hypothetical protein